MRRRRSGAGHPRNRIQEAAAVAAVVLAVFHVTVDTLLFFHNHTSVGYIVGIGGGIYTLLTKFRACFTIRRRR